MEVRGSADCPARRAMAALEQSLGSACLADFMRTKPHLAARATGARRSIARP